MKKFALFICLLLCSVIGFSQSLGGTKWLFKETVGNAITFELTFENDGRAFWKGTNTPNADVFSWSGDINNVSVEGPFGPGSTITLWGNIGLGILDYSVRGVVNGQSYTQTGQYKTTKLQDAPAPVVKKTKKQPASNTPYLPTKTFVFPGGGIRNNNNYLGDFCCTGETGVVQDNFGNYVGYIYFFGWGNKPAEVTDEGVVIDQLEILLSGAKTFDNVLSPVRDKTVLLFPNNEVFTGSQLSTTIGRILYTVRILNVEFRMINGNNTGKFYMNSIRVEVTAQQAY